MKAGDHKSADDQYHKMDNNNTVGSWKKTLDKKEYYRKYTQGKIFPKLLFSFPASNAWKADAQVDKGPDKDKKAGEHALWERGSHSGKPRNKNKNGRRYCAPGSEYHEYSGYYKSGIFSFHRKKL